MHSKKIIKDISIVTTGDVMNCHHCRAADSEIPGYVTMKKGTYEYVPIDSAKAKEEIRKAAQILKKDVKKIDSIPIVRIKKTECQKDACKTVETVLEGYDREEIKKELGLV